MYAVDLSTPARRARPEPRRLFETTQRISSFDVAADGRFLVILADDAITAPINLILNWAPPAD